MTQQDIPTPPLQLALSVIWKLDTPEALAIRKAIVAAKPTPIQIPARG